MSLAKYMEDHNLTYDDVVLWVYDTVYETDNGVTFTRDSSFWEHPFEGFDCSDWEVMEYTVVNGVHVLMIA